MQAHSPTARTRPIPASKTLPNACGIGLRALHMHTIARERPDIAWLEVHSENFFAAGGTALRLLETLRAHYPIALHGVGMSLGTTDTLDTAHLDKLKRLDERIDAAHISEHLCWGAIGERHFNDLLPLPYTEEALAQVCRHIDQMQNHLGRRILVENVSRYLRYEHETLPEWEFLAATARHSGCGLLLDINNVYVNARNFDFDPNDYLQAIPAEKVEEIHLAGFDDSGPCLIDTHGAPVAEAVWQLYRQSIERLGPRPTLIEWDTDIPPLDVLLDERNHAQHILHEYA